MKDFTPFDRAEHFWKDLWEGKITGGRIRLLRADGSVIPVAPCVSCNKMFFQDRPTNYCAECIRREMMEE